MVDVDIKIPLLMTHDNAVNGPLLYVRRNSQYNNNNNNNKDVRAEVWERAKDMSFTVEALEFEPADEERRELVRGYNILVIRWKSSFPDPRVT